MEEREISIELGKEIEIDKEGKIWDTLPCELMEMYQNGEKYTRKNNNKNKNKVGIGCTLSALHCFSWFIYSIFYQGLAVLAIGSFWTNVT